MWSKDELRSVNLVKAHDIKHYFYGKKGADVNFDELNANECISYISGIFSMAGVYDQEVDFMRVLYIVINSEKRKLVCSVLRQLDVLFKESGDRVDIDNDADNLIRFHRYILPLDNMAKLVIASPYHMEAVRYEQTRRRASLRRSVASAS